MELWRGDKGDNMFKIRAAITACALAFITAGAANADTLKSFNISGTFEQAAACVNGGCGTIPFSGLAMTGTLVLCETCSLGNGEWTQASITLNVPDLTPFVGTSSTASDAGLGVRDDVLNSQSLVFQIFIPTPLNNNADFTDYDGGPIGGGPVAHDTAGTWADTPFTVTCAGPFGPTACELVLTDLVGTITPEVSETPLPAALPLFAGGLGMMGLLARRRKQRAALAAG
jgi:hypothetical protein